MIHRWAPGCNCCGCLVMEDDFELGSIDTAKWEEVQGTWSVSCPSTCQINGSGSHAIIKSVKTIDGYMVANADLTTADDARILIHYEDDNNYVCLELDSAFGGTVNLITRSSGSDTTRATKTALITPLQEWTICSNATCYSAFSADGNHLISWNHSGVPSGALSAGLAVTSGTSSMAAESFSMWESDPDETDEECPECSCGCTGCTKHGANVAPTLTADIDGAWDSAGCPNLTVDASYGLTKSDTCEWKYEVSQANNIVWKIVVNASVSPPTIRIDYTHDGSDDFALMQLNQSAIPDCSEGNFSGTFGAITGVCFDGINSVTVTG